MHTGASLDYPQCKCMNCAKARNDNLIKEARRRHPDTFPELEAAIARGEGLAAEAAQILHDAQRARDQVLVHVQAELDNGS
jgi:hypothetical protein